MVYSFDVFDTLITRTTAEPKGIFLIMQENLSRNKKYVEEYPYVINHFAEYRISAEQEARRKAIRSEIEEVCLHDIYIVLQSTCGVEEETIKEWMVLEQETEFQNAVPIWKNIEMLKEYLRNDKVLLISDMYLPSDSIRKMLCKFDAVFETIPLFVSCENLKTKRNGSLYEHIMVQENIDPKQWIHTGDNSHSDGVVVERLDGKSRIETACELTQRDKLFMDVNAFRVEYQLTLGAIKCVRLQSEKNELACRVGLEFAAPILYGYVLWVLERSIELGKRNLFFIARDGYILKEIADRIISFRKWDINTYYIYGSRMAWKTPFLLRTPQLAKEWFFDNYRKYNFEEIASELGVEKEELIRGFPEKLAESEFPSESVNERNRVQASLSDSDEVWINIANKANEKRNLTKEYIKQELNGKEDVAFVEFNGTGKSLICLSELLKDELELPIVTFYYSMFKVSDFSKKSNLFYQFSYQYLDPGVCLLEHFARAPHGQTQGYKMQDGKYVPILGVEPDGVDSEEEWLAYFDAIVSFTEEIEKQEITRFLDFSKVSLDYIQYANRFEDADLQKFIGDMFFSSKACRDGKILYAPVITDEVLDKMRTCQYRGEWRKYYQGEHLDFSLKRMTPEKQKIYQVMLEEDVNKPVAFPDYLKVDGKVVLYGAGKYGKRIYSEYQNNHHGEIVLWVDKNYETLNDEKIVSPSVIESAEYDYVIIGILDYDIYCEVFRYLIGLGVLPGKII